jgi:anti-sigma B factor antagonist
MTKGRFRLDAAKAELPPVVIATGEVDLANLGDFEDVLTRAAADRPAITVDLSQVTYCDSAAMRALFSVAANTRLSLIIPASGPITTVLRISGLDRIATVTTVD